MILSAYNYRFSRGYYGVNFNAAGGLENYVVCIDYKKKTFPATIQGHDDARAYYDSAMVQAEKQEKYLED